MNGFPYHHECESFILTVAMALITMLQLYKKSNNGSLRMFIKMDHGFTDVIKVKDYAVEIKEFKFFSAFPRKHVESNITVFHSNIPHPKNYYLMDLEDKPIVSPPKENYFWGYRTKYQLYHLTNVVYSSCSAFVVDSIDYCFDRVHHRTGKVEITKIFKNAICVTNIFPDCYGDFIFGSLIRLTLVPRYLFAMCYTLTNAIWYQGYLTEMMRILDIDMYTFHHVGEYEPVFCENLYTILPLYIQDNFDRAPLLLHSIHGPLSNKFAEMMRHFYGADKLIPYEYTIYNRLRGKKRSFANFDEMHTALRNEFPSLNITKFEGNLPTIEANVQQHAKLKWYFSFCGSNFMNCLFMAEGTAATMAMCDKFDMPAFQVCLSRNIHVVSFMCQCEHHGNPIAVDISRALRYVRMSLNHLRAI